MVENDSFLTDGTVYEIREDGCCFTTIAGEDGYRVVEMHTWMPWDVYWKRVRGRA